MRQSMGSEDFAHIVFDKIFKDDVERLRSMEDMWKSRSPPKALDFNTLSEASKSQQISAVAQGQQPWNEVENFSVFRDSINRLSARLQAMQTAGTDVDSKPVLIFEKDDEDVLDFVASSANLRAMIFGIDTKSKFDTKQMAGNIIPAIATTNAMVAGLCVLQAFKILRNDFRKTKNVFLERSTKQVINTETLRPPNPDCAVCSVTSTRLTIDPERAKLKNLVEDVLKKQLGYGDMSINSEAGIIYDPDLDDNLAKKFSELGVKGDSFITVMDDDDENPRVNLSLAISEL